MHGGIGMTWKLPLPHYAKRLTMIDHQLGDADYHLDRDIRLGEDSRRGGGMTQSNATPADRTRIDHRRRRRHRPGHRGQPGTPTLQPCARRHRRRWPGSRRAQSGSPAACASAPTGSMSSDAAAVAALPAQVLASHPGVDLLFNNAGRGARRPLRGCLGARDFDWLLSINLQGVVRMTRAFLPLLRRSDDARLVNLSSLFGLVAPPGQAAYAASKFAVRGFLGSAAARACGQQRRRHRRASRRRRYLDRPQRAHPHERRRRRRSSARGSCSSVP